MHITLHERYAPDLDERRVSVVSGELSRAILNIVVNACQAVTRKRHSTDDTYDPTLRISTEATERTVTIRVWDNGDGIEESSRDRIFQPFFSAASSGEGTGLGLSMAHEIVVGLHQGTLEVSSQAGECTEFVIQLPI